MLALDSDAPFGKCGCAEERALVGSLNQQELGVSAVQDAGRSYGGGEVVLDGPVCRILRLGL